MDLLNERIGQELYERAILIFELHDKRTPEIERLADLAYERYMESKALVGQFPENEILQENHNMLLLVALIFEMGCLL